MPTSLEPGKVGNPTADPSRTEFPDRARRLITARHAPANGPPEARRPSLRFARLLMKVRAASKIAVLIDGPRDRPAIR